MQTPRVSQARGLAGGARVVAGSARRRCGGRLQEAAAAWLICRGGEGRGRGLSTAGRGRAPWCGAPVRHRRPGGRRPLPRAGRETEEGVSQVEREREGYREKEKSMDLTVNFLKILHRNSKFSRNECCSKFRDVQLFFLPLFHLRLSF